MNLVRPEAWSEIVNCFARTSPLAGLSIQGNETHFDCTRIVKSPAPALLLWSMFRARWLPRTAMGDMYVVTHTGSIETTIPAMESMPHRIQSGSLIKHYEVIRSMGEGGMGHVFLARDTKLGRLVAIKTITRAKDSRRWLSEARATARCNHENIVIIHETDEFQSHHKLSELFCNLIGCTYGLLLVLLGITVEGSKRSTLAIPSSDNFLSIV